ncbi:tetratricopeptide repeat protein [Halomonas sp. E19]|uniref:tetratricopeptide repeat protein n=1 Tax=unclassified Halomonas TaxID=2609666 RepID=UPI0040347039
MTQTSSLFTRLEYRLAEQLFHTRWLPRSPRTQRLTLHLFQRCADAGHPAALSLYGHMLFHRGTTPQDKAKGARYVLEAAQAGDLKAQYQAGLIHEHGCAQYPRREERAVTWYARAGEAGHPLAAERLAKAYRHGELGLAVDAIHAEHWQAIADRAVALERLEPGTEGLDSRAAKTRH